MFATSLLLVSYCSPAQAANDAILSKLKEKQQADAAAEITSPVGARIERLQERT